MKTPFLYCFLVWVAISVSSCNKDTVVDNRYFYQVYENLVYQGSLTPVAVMPLGNSYIIAATTYSITGELDGGWYTYPSFLLIDSTGKIIRTLSHQLDTASNTSKNLIGLFPWQIIPDEARGKFAVATSLETNDFNCSSRLQWISDKMEWDTCGWAAECPVWNLPKDEISTYPTRSTSPPPAVAFLYEGYKTTIASLRYDDANALMMHVDMFLENGDKIYSIEMDSSAIREDIMDTNAYNWAQPGTNKRGYYHLVRGRGDTLYLSTPVEKYDAQGEFTGFTPAMLKFPINGTTSGSLETMFILSNDKNGGNDADFIAGFFFDTDTATYPLMVYTQKQRAYLGRYTNSKILNNYYPLADMSGTNEIQVLTTPDKKEFYVIGTSLSGGILIYKFMVVGKDLYDLMYKTISGPTTGIEFANAVLTPNGDLVITGSNTFNGLVSKPFLMRLNGATGEL